MKYIDEFRNVDITQKLIEKISEKFQALFTREEISEAQRRLEELGYFHK